jgi:hypothetical protein
MGSRDIWPENILIRMLVIVHGMHQATNGKTVKDRSIYDDAATQLNDDCKYDPQLVSATTRQYTRQQVQDKYENFKRFQLPKIWKQIANPYVFAPSGAPAEPLHKLVDWNKLDGPENRLNRKAYELFGEHPTHGVLKASHGHHTLLTESRANSLESLNEVVPDDAVTSPGKGQTHGYGPVSLDVL